jgi:dUTP pyrophosphatase
VGFDIASAEQDFILMPNERRFVSTGFSIELPPQVECQVRPRSGLARDHGVILLYSPSTIDPDYRGEIFAPLWNTGEKEVLIKRGARVAQIVFQLGCIPDIIEVQGIADETERGTKGFGSTGTETRS